MNEQTKKLKQQKEASVIYMEIFAQIKSLNVSGLSLF